MWTAHFNVPATGFLVLHHLFVFWSYNYVSPEDNEDEAASTPVPKRRMAKVYVRILYFVIPVLLLGVAVALDLPTLLIGGTRCRRLTWETITQSVVLSIEAVLLIVLAWTSLFGGYNGTIRASIYLCCLE